MKWISVKDELPPDNTGGVIVVYLKPFFGVFTLAQTVGYYDDPKDYEDEDGKGWLTWMGDIEILVTHWKPLSELPETEFAGVDQKEFKKRFNGFRPNLGSVY